MSISSGISRAVRHPIVGNLFANPRINTLTAGNDRNSFFNGVDGKLTFTRASTGTFLGSDGFIQVAAVDEFRFDYDPLDQALQSSGGWLCERDTTNLLIRSEELDDAAWTKTGCTITANSDTAPDGATTMDTIREDSSTGAHGIEMTSASFVGGAIVTASCWADDLNRDFLHIEIESSSGVNDAWFNLSTGTVGTTAGTDFDGASIIGPYRNGRYRCLMRINTGPGDTTSVCRFEAADTDNSSSYTGTTQDSILCWGCQFEVADMTSYVATAAATVTRAQDRPTIAIEDISPNHMDMYIEFDFLTIPNAGLQILTVLATDTGANGESFALSQVTNNGMTINISDDAGALRFTTFAFNDGDYGTRTLVTVNWDNARVNRNRVWMEENGSAMSFVSATQPGSAHWTDMPTTLMLWDTSRETSMKVRSFVIGP